MIQSVAADSRLPASMEALLQNILIVGASIFLILLVFPWFLVAVFVFAIAFAFFSRIFQSGLRDLKRYASTQCRLPLIIMY